MLDHRDSHPEYFEELCALAASGQISQLEFNELQEHLKECGECRSVYADFIGLVHHTLPLAQPEAANPSRLSSLFSEGSTYRERFVARARKEGVSVSGAPLLDRPRSKFRIWADLRFRYAQLAMLAVAALLVTVGLLGYSLRESNLRYLKLAAERSVATAESNPQSRAVTRLPEESSVTTPTRVDAIPPPSAVSQAGSVSIAELDKVRTDRAAAESRSKVLEDQMNKLASELEAFRAQNAEMSGSRGELEKKLKDAEQVANAIKDDLQEIRQARSKDSLTIATQDLEIQKLSEKLAAQAETLEQEKSLLEASRAVRDLMGSRNFHIADVYEVDSKGKDQRAFGRVFTTEKNSALIFYAFDLNDRNTAKRNASFQVWGKRGAGESRAHSLGLFQIDDQKQNRWVLRFEDPQVLAEIDSVFVTIEPPGGSAKPTSRQLLFAYLNANPNRP
jgi:hypothetical protein